MALGTALLIAQGVGAGINALVGARQRRQGRRLAREGRRNLLAEAGPTAEVLSGVDEQKAILGAGQQRAQERLDSGVAGFLAALQAGDPATMGAAPAFANQIGQAGADLSAQTAAATAAANQPLIDASLQEQQLRQQLNMLDLTQGQTAFDQGTQTMLDSAGQILDLPMDLATLQTANAGAFADLFPKLAAQDGVKVGQAGVYTGGGINAQTIKDLIALMPEKDDEDDEGAGQEEEVSEERELTAGQQKREAARDARKKERQELKGQDMGFLERIRKVREAGRDARMTVSEEMKINKEMGGKMGPGDVFKTPGPEDHNKKEFDIIDAESGQTVARTTGQENHTINNDDPDQKYKIVDKDTREVLMESEGGSMSVLNSNQSESIHDAFKDIDVPMLLKFLERYPQKAQVRELMSALNVFTLPQFQD